MTDHSNDKRDDAKRLAFQLVGEGITCRADRPTVEEIRRRLDAVQDAIINSSTFRRAHGEVA